VERGVAVAVVSEVRIFVVLWFASPGLSMFTESVGVDHVESSSTLRWCRCHAGSALGFGRTTESHNSKAEVLSSLEVQNLLGIFLTGNLQPTRRNPSFILCQACMLIWIVRPNPLLGSQDQTQRPTETHPPWNFSSGSRSESEPSSSGNPSNGR